MRMTVIIFGFAMLILGVATLLTAFILHLGYILSIAIYSFGGGCAVMGILLLIGAIKIKD